jgi:hypothetical protein
LLSDLIETLGEAVYKLAAGTSGVIMGGVACFGLASGNPIGGIAGSAFELKGFLEF